MRYLLVLLIAFSITSCSTTKQPFLANGISSDFESRPQKKLVESLYLIGDTGDPNNGENDVLPALQRMLNQETKAASIVFLGDQIYPVGLPKKGAKNRSQAEQILNPQLDILKDFQGKAYFIPGERDWKDQQEKGLKAVKRQEEYVESYFSEKNKVRFYPNDGCADPKLVKITKDLVYLFLDTQWWLQNWDDEKKINQGCEIKSKYDLLEVIKENLTEHKNDEVVVFMHHPIYSNGNHGGRFSWKDHLFPFAETGNVSIPLPVLGSLFIVGRNITGLKQDIPNRHYQELMGGIEKIAQGLSMNVLFASAHDNGLQHFSSGKLQYVVSGSGSRTHFIGKGGDANFAYEARGFSRVLFYEDFETWLEFYAVPSSSKNAKLVYRTRIRAPRPGSTPEEKKYPPISKTDTVVAANSSFEANNFKGFMMGDQYREIWMTPVQAELIDLETKFGGLEPIKKGGGMSSNSLRMQKQDGKQYILRSINKDYRKLVPPGLSTQVLIDILQDQNSASHPYGALVIPTLSKAAGVYYTDPQLVFLKHQTGLGNYNSQFPEELYLLEQRPSGDWGDADQFGRSDKIIGYTDLLANLREKKTYFIDQQWVCKSRLFDLFLHDWDRHDDQWRWATFKEEEQTICRPIPRDRDQAFYKFQGLVPGYIATFLARQLKTMQEEVKDVRHLAFNARYFDRYFMNALEWSDWQKAVQHLQDRLTDEVIDEAMKTFPIETQGVYDQELGKKLKARRDNMLAYAKELYDYQAKEVEITGTDHKDIFEISTTSTGDTKVRVWVQRKEKGDLLKYERTFYPHETKEVRLYGLRDKDQFIIKGDSKNSIQIRIIGGDGMDQVTNETGGRKVKVYDASEGVDMQGPRLLDKTSDDVGVNEYNRRGFNYNTSFPFVTFGYTPDDGFWLGGSYSWVTHGWRKTPYQAKQKIGFSIAPNSRRAIQASYSGHFPNVLGQLGFIPSIDFSVPYYENYFGLGNDTPESNERRAFNWVRLEAFSFAPLWQFDFKDRRSLFQFGPIFETYKIKNSEGRVSEDDIIGFTADEFDRRNFLGAKMHLASGFVDDQNFPSNGFKFTGDFSYLNTLNNAEDVYSLDASVQFYVTLN
ncbi:MAG: hypothetical protein AAF242_06705, partial [Bacteroidota bacterium]